MILNAINCGQLYQNNGTKIYLAYTAGLTTESGLGMRVEFLDSKYQAGSLRPRET